MLDRQWQYKITDSKSTMVYKVMHDDLSICLNFYSHSICFSQYPALFTIEQEKNAFLKNFSVLHTGSSQITIQDLFPQKIIALMDSIEVADASFISIMPVIYVYCTQNYSNPKFWRDEIFARLNKYLETDLERGIKFLHAFQNIYPQADITAELVKAILAYANENKDSKEAWRLRSAIFSSAAIMENLAEECLADILSRPIKENESKEEKRNRISEELHLASKADESFARQLMTELCGYPLGSPSPGITFSELGAHIRKLNKVIKAQKAEIAQLRRAEKLAPAFPLENHPSSQTLFKYK